MVSPTQFIENKIKNFCEEYGTDSYDICKRNLDSSETIVDARAKAEEDEDVGSEVYEIFDLLVKLKNIHLEIRKVGECYLCEKEDFVRDCKKVEMLFCEQCYVKMVGSSVCMNCRCIDDCECCECDEDDGKDLGDWETIE
jgi:hypothetical protein